MGSKHAAPDRAEVERSFRQLFFSYIVAGALTSAEPPSAISWSDFDQLLLTPECYFLLEVFQFFLSDDTSYSVGVPLGKEQRCANTTLTVIE